MSLDEVENKVLLGAESDSEIAPMTEIKIKCRNKIVYVPYYVAVQYNFLKSYLENWKKIEKRNNDNDLLTINLYSPEDLQNEFDSKARLISISDYLGYSGETEKKDEDEKVKHLFLEDVIDFKTGSISSTKIDELPVSVLPISEYYPHCVVTVNNITKYGKLYSGNGVSGRLCIGGEEFGKDAGYSLEPEIRHDWNSALRKTLKKEFELLSLFFPPRNK